jgi:hypothetical protein
MYPIFLLYELLRLWILLREGAQSGISALTITWYAAVPLLCVVPVMFFMLSFSESDYVAWLPLATLIKALGLPSLILYIAKSAPTAIRFAASGNLDSLRTVLSVTLFVLCDIAIGIYCFGRNRKLCK